MWRYRIPYLAVICAAATAYVLADRSEALFFLVILILLPLLSALLEHFALKSLSLSCRLKGSCRLGQKMGIRFRVKRKHALPLGAICMDVLFDNRLFREKQKVELVLCSGESRDMTFYYRYSGDNCGRVRVTAGDIACYDVLGLFCWKKKIDLEEDFVIYPPELSLHMELSRRPETKNVGELYDPYKKGQDVNEVSNLREYAPGDALHSIHWKLSSKMDKLIVREFGYPSNYNTVILYEVMKESSAGPIHNQCNNAVLALTVNVSYGLMERNVKHNVGRVFEGKVQTVPVQSVSAHELMEAGLLAMPMAEQGNLAGTVDIFLTENSKNEYTKVIYITPVYEEGALKPLVQAVDLTVIHVLRGKNVGYTASADYTIIPVDADTYQEHLHSMVI